MVVKKFVGLKGISIVHDSWDHTARPAEFAVKCKTTAFQRGLCIYLPCDAVINADVNGAITILNLLPFAGFKG